MSSSRPPRDTVSKTGGGTRHQNDILGGGDAEKPPFWGVQPFFGVPPLAYFGPPLEFLGSSLEFLGSPPHFEPITVVFWGGSR